MKAFKPLFAEFLKRFAACFSLLWLFLESAISLGIVGSPQKGAAYYIGLIFSSLVFALINQLLNKINQRSLILLSKRRKARQHTRGIKKIIDIFIRENSYFKTIFADLLMEKKAKMLSDIANGSVQLYSKTSFNNTIDTLTSIVNRLGVGVVYYALTSIECWRYIDITKGVFISENLDAIKRGVIIQRVVLIDGSLFNRSSNDGELIQLKKIIRNIYDYALVNSELFNKMELKFYICHTNEEYLEKSSDPVPYAILAHSKFDDSLTIYPALKEDIDNTPLRLQFNNDKSSSNYIKDINLFSTIFNDKDKNISLQLLHDKLFTKNSKNMRYT